MGSAGGTEGRATGCEGRVVHPEEDTAFGSPERGRPDVGVFEGLPGHLQQEALPWIQGSCLGRGDAEEADVERVDVPDGSRRHGGSVGIGIFRERRGVFGAEPVAGQCRDGIVPGGEEAPVGIEIGHAAGEAATAPDDGHGVGVDGVLRLALGEGFVVGSVLGLCHRCSSLIVRNAFFRVLVPIGGIWR